MRIGGVTAGSAFVLFLAGLIFEPVAVAAQDWDRLADGRVVIEIFGERLAFAPEDGPMVEFWDGGQRMFDLEHAIAEPDLAKRQFQKVKIGKPLRIMIKNDVYWREKLGRSFLGKFDWSGIPTKGFPHYLSIYVNRSDKNENREPILYPNETFPISVDTTPRGFSVYPHKGVVSMKPMQPKTTIYVLHGRERIRKTDYKYIVRCDWGGAPTRSCRAHLRSKDNQVRVTWSWWEDQYPEKTWQALDVRLQDIADHLFVGRERRGIQ